TEGFNVKEQLKIGLILFWLGFTGYYFASLTDFIGLSYISAGLERLVLFTYPTLVLAIESIWKRKAPSMTTVSGVFICYLGLFAAFSHDLSQAGQSEEIWIGVGWVALSGLSFAFYYLATSSIVAKIGARKLTGYAGVVATICTLVHFALVGDWTFLQSLTNDVLLLIAAISILCTILPSLFLASAIQRLGPGLTANLGSIGPMLTILIAWWLLGETISAAQVLGMGLVVLGIHQMKKVA
ncbi:MAG: DMT family transporter, partial [Kangiellaceae bacterium]|nr:DMT family transporter [Kangiellaceae bacterium]